VITKGVLERVFCIRHGDSIGTAFTVDIDGKQYIITAKHVIDGLFGVGRPSTVEVLRDRTWHNIGARLVGEAPLNCDIAVLACDVLLSPPAAITASSSGIVYGQDLYFLGFPYGLHSDSGDLNHGFPFPLVKKGILSNIQKQEDGTVVFLIDGHNNPGFSGGPVVWARPGKITPRTPGEIVKLDYSVGAVISAYRFAYDKVYLGGEETPLAYRQNTGIVIAHPVDEAVKIIEANPAGCPIK